MALLLQHWLPWSVALYKIPPAIPCNPIEAIYYLADAVLDGHVRTRFPNGDTIPAEQWHVPDDGWGLETESGQHIAEAEIHRADLVKWLKHREPDIGRKRGPKDDYDWPGMEAYLVADVLEWGVPEVQATLIKQAKNWFKYNKPPNERPKRTQLGVRVRLIIEAHRKQRELSGE